MYEPRVHARVLILIAAILCAPVIHRTARAGSDWIPPRPVQLLAPSATLDPGKARTLQFLVRTNGAPANLKWTATTSGNFNAAVSPTMGTLALQADQTATVSLSVTVPNNVNGDAVGYVSLRLVYDTAAQGWAINPDARITIRAATGGRPEVIPMASSWPSAAGTVANVSFQIHSLVSPAENFTLTHSRTNPDPNNAGLLFLGGVPSSPVLVPGGATVVTTVPTTLPGNTFPGDLNAIKIIVTSLDDPNKGESDGAGFAVVSAPHPDSLPMAMAPRGLVPLNPALSTNFVSRDGPILLPGRGLYVVPAGFYGIQVVRDSVLDQVGPLDLNNNGMDDRLVGRVRIPAYAAALAVIPGFVTTTDEIFDLGLLACGRDGLMLVRLQDVVDPWLGTWEDWFDWDGNGIDDRILRMLPIQGFATDVEWFRTPESRYVAVVAAADTGSNPVTAGYNPLARVPNTGAGVVAIDINAALDSIPSVPYLAGTLPTPGTTLDLALRGGPAPDLAVADGADSVTFWRLIASGSPASVGFERRAAVALSGTWGSRLARDLDWLPPNPTSDSTWLAVASGAAGLQLIKAPPLGTPFLALVQRTTAPTIGIATTDWGNVAVAMGAAGGALFKLPRNEVLDLVGPGAPPPYSSPVVLDSGTPWPGSTPLLVGTHGTLQSSLTSFRFAPVSTPGAIPDLMCTDGLRALRLHPGAQQSVLGVPNPPLASAAGPRLRVVPNPVRQGAAMQVLGGSGLGAGSKGGPVVLEILDLQGRLVRRIDAPMRATGSGMLAAAEFDGRDNLGRALGPGLYWVRAKQDGVWSARAGFVVLR